MQTRAHAVWRDCAQTLEPEASHSNVRGSTPCHFTARKPPRPFSSSSVAYSTMRHLRLCSATAALARPCPHASSHLRSFAPRRTRAVRSTMAAMLDSIRSRSCPPPRMSRATIRELCGCNAVVIERLRQRSVPPQPTPPSRRAYHMSITPRRLCALPSPSQWLFGCERALS